MSVMSLKKKSGLKGRRSKSFTDAIAYRCTTSRSNIKPQYISPFDLCNQLKDKLPLQLTVIQGTYGDKPVTTFGDDEKLTAYFVQSLEYVSFRTTDGKLLRIPVNSSVSASTIYNPQNDLNQALNGYVFPTPSKLMMQSVFPKFVVVLQEHVEEDPKFTVEANDVLLIVGNTKSGKKRTLKCIHVASGLTKFIREESSEVKLSTKPELVLVPLKTLMQYTSGPTPVLVSLSRSMLPSGSVGEIVGVLLAEKSKCCNLLCTREAFHTSESCFFYAIPESLDLDLEEVSSSNEEHEALCIKTTECFQHFDLAKVNYENLCFDCGNDEHNQMQLAFYNSILHDKRENGISFPDKLRKYLRPSRNFSTGKLPQASIASIENRVALLEETMQTLFREIKLLNEKLDRVTLQGPEKNQDEGIAQTAFDMVVGVQKATSNLQRNEESIMKKLNTLSESVTQLTSTTTFADGDYQPLIPPKTFWNDSTNVIANRPPAVTSSVSPTSTSSGDTCTISSMNQQYLSTLTVYQVGEILASLNMNEHIRNFQIEQIDGKKLAGFKKLDLLKLRITDENHKNKLIQLITGEMSAYPLITTI